MKKLNSEFKTAFISEAGAALTNNDYFAFVELDNYACYVIADGITDLAQSESAQKAVESIILHFGQQPSLARRSLRACLQKANRDLLETNGREVLKASITVIVTDYEVMRYASAGNTRLRLYRDGTLNTKSKDMSLSQDLVEKDEITPNVLSRHDERHNLYTYLGQEKDFRPFLSGKLKLMNGDIAVLYTRGIWENLEEADLDDIFSETTDDPQEPLDNAEDMLLSKQVPDLDNYTMAAIFVNKVFTDPNRDRRRKRIIKIIIIALIVMIIVGIIAYILYSRHRDKVDEMNLRTDNTIACIQDNNYIRAQEEVKKALQQAENLKDKEKIAQINNYLRLIESIIAADDAYYNKKFDDAYQGYQTALERSRYADKLGETYVSRRIVSTEDNLTVADFINLGDKVMEQGDLVKAEVYYLRAKAFAAKIHTAEGKVQAQTALDKVYEAKQKQKEEQEKKDKQKLMDDISDLITQGDTLSQFGDLDMAEQKYLAARSLASANYDADGKKEAMAALDKLDQARGKIAAAAQKAAEKHAAEYMAAAALVGQGDAAFANADYTGAAASYHAALAQYTVLSDTAQSAIVSSKLQNVAVKQKELEQQRAAAVTAVTQAAGLYAEKEYTAAKQMYLKAQQLYLALGNQAKADELKTILEEIDADAAIMATLPQ
ncbi:PP2C family protein-serine/threonine phosphatase [Sporomusa sphaeroides]|uniref:PP2C family protein-serine/threonine phosphatase n=1 Tax=Sporomusa sphaeroides TaxID=47679 RepID=UPI002B87D971|nr:PP2C family serine/threonine-protein phosphatase [Sporomusa sphaeroides]HML32137.1 PP2C family serine/threonine-protein phosphatase [Sporomusa sphaeroides]